MIVMYNIFFKSCLHWHYCCPKEPLTDSKLSIGPVSESAQARLIVKETYGWPSASPARPAIPAPTSSSFFQYALHTILKVQY